jgi:hypothetical protein
MSTTDGRRERMQRLLKCLCECKNSSGLTPNEIAQRTELLTEIQMDRLYKYLAELEWCGMLVKHGNRYKLMDGLLGTFIKKEREKKKVKEKGQKKEKKVEIEKKEGVKM